MYPTRLGFSLTTLIALLPAVATAQVTFQDTAVQKGVDTVSFGRASAMADLDQDGRMDLIAVNAGMSNFFYRQLADQTFVETSAAWGIAPDTRQHWSGLLADFDNDGDDDFYIVNGGFMFAEANQLLRNDLNTAGTFSDVSSTSGDANDSAQSFGGTTGDFDNDGDLDIFTTTSDANLACVLLDNLGNLQFADVSTQTGITHVQWFSHCSAGDFNNDGWMDIAVGGYIAQNLLYMNLKTGKFQNVAPFVGVASPQRNFGLVLEDFNNDGWLDLFAPKYNKAPLGAQISQLFRNGADQNFYNVTHGSGMTTQTDMGHNTGDVDGDGFPDILIGTGHPTFKDYDRLFLMTPNAFGGFSSNDVSVSSGITVLGKTRSHGMALGDVNQDGTVDIFANNGGPSTMPTTIEQNSLFEAAPNGNHWVSFELEGVVSNRSAVGAHVVAYTNTGKQVHRYKRVGHGFGNTNSPVQHVAIGQDTAVDLLQIQWPSGIVQTLLQPTMSTVHSVIETGLIAPDVAPIGGTYNILFAGPSSQSAQLFYSTTTLVTPIPSLGGLLELGAPFTNIGGSTLGGDGTSTFPVQVPNFPALAGLTIHLQALFFEPAPFGNLTLSNRLSPVLQ